MFVYQKNPMGIELFSLLFQAIWKAADHVTEDDLYLLLKEITNSYSLIVSE